MPDANGEPTASDLAHALQLLRGQVRLMQHRFKADPASDAGNCWCGRSWESGIHYLSPTAWAVSVAPGARS